jgi:hypothetical protein
LWSRSARQTFDDPAFRARALAFLAQSDARRAYWANKQLADAILWSSPRYPFSVYDPGYEISRLNNSVRSLESQLFSQGY